MSMYHRRTCAVQHRLGPLKLRLGPEPHTRAVVLALCGRLLQQGATSDHKMILATPKPHFERTLEVSYDYKRFLFGGSGCQNPV